MYYQIIGTNVRLAGSLHMVPASASLPNWVTEAYEWSEDIYLEGNGAEVQRHCFLPAGESSEARMPPELWVSLRARWGLDFPSGPALEPQKLWFIATSLATSGVKLRPGVEPFIENRARAENRAVSYLESAAEVAKLFDGVPDTAYHTALAVLLGVDVQARVQNVADMYGTWINGDPEVLMSVMRRLPLSEIPAIWEVIFPWRNTLWLPRILDILKAGRRTVIFVGAGHLGGASGLLALLERAGYKCRSLLSGDVGGGCLR